MSWTSDVAFLEGLELFSGVVGRLQSGDWQRPSPCAGWTALDVVGHVGSAVRFGTALLRGEQPAWAPVDPPGGAVDGEPAQWWGALVEPARQAVRAADLDQVVDSPMGRRTVAEGLAFPALDLFVHAWDLGRAAGIDVEIPAEAIAFGHAVVDPIPAEMVRSTRVFGPEVPAPPEATATERFIAWTGRDPRAVPPPH